MSANEQSRMPQGLESEFRQQVDRLHRFTVLMRWSVVLFLWLTVGTLSLWGFRYEISLMREHFTWAALRYGILFNRLPAIGLALCIGMTLSVLYWQTRNIFWGRSPRWQQRLEKQVLRIRQQGQGHPLWHWVCRQ
ncbi:MULTISPECIES: hypothetical protein [unclassified Thermosynechococcus]|uniref:hypothetical protein n=1 Tax=unclassified Thermosynechococcus TaxID=2622553 RepID=UPI0019EB4701|nr:MULTISPECIES: hypothetical protein [unclassified Thermosynechococcus]HIK34813.1 hypothetical protein [Thermosynechococcus sp. M98_K2018_005]HIK47542.1 hypothetical protein [Thermosynechococcus sp. M55_K2018_012]